MGKFDFIKYMSDEELEAYLAGRPPWEGYRPGMYSRSISPHGGVYQEFLRDIEQEGDEEQVIDTYVRKLLARGGWKKEEARRRLLQALAREKKLGVSW